MSDPFLMDSHKLHWHPDRVAAWLRGEAIAPLHIDAGLSKGCNIRCDYCFGAMQGNLYERGKGIFFPREPLLRYLRDAGEAGVRSIALIGEGEPLLNPHAYEAIVCGKRSGVDMALGTNGVLFDTGRAGEEALEHLTWVRFNLSAGGEEAYRRIHGADAFAAVVERIGHCVRVKRERNLGVTIGLQMVLTPGNVDQVVPLANLGRRLGVDYLVVKQCSDSREGTLGVFGRLDEYGGFSATLQEAQSLGGPGYSVIVKWRKVTNRGERAYRRCLGAPFLLYSSGDGRIYPCGMFFRHREEEFRLGDLTAQRLPEILASPRYREVMAKVAAIDVQGECYSNCRTDAINDYAWRLTHPPDHVNFI